MPNIALQAPPRTEDAPVPPGTAPRRPFSPREKQILELVTSGRTRKEVAFDLGIASATVRVLYSRAMANLGRAKREMMARHPTPTRAQGRSSSCGPGISARRA